MSVSYSYPGIYIQEQISSSHAIVPAPTSIAAFVGYSHPFQTAAFNVAQEIFSFNDYQTYFGPLFSSGLIDASLPRAVYQFFLNGGSSAWVVGLQPGLFDGNGDIITRLGSANGGATITASTGGGPSPEVAFAIAPATALPAISSLSPTSVTKGGAAFTLTVNGSNFLPGSKVFWNGTALTGATVVSPNQITVSVPATRTATAGSASVTVVSPAPSGASAAVTFTINNADPIPVLASISPTTVPAGGPAFPLTVTGANFVAASTVNWNGTALTTTYVSDTQLTATVPATDIATAGTAAVTVNTTGAGTSGSSTFTVGVAAPAPTISTLSPASTTAGSAAFTLTVNGSNFVAASTVNWNGSALTTTFVTASQLTAAIPAANVAAGGTAVVTVVNPAPGGASPALTFTVNGSNLIPAISSLSPSSAPAGAGAFTLTVQGRNFVPASTVNWDGTPLTTTYVSDTQLTAQVPASDVTAAGAGYVTVSNPQGAGIVFTALELTDVVPMNVTITNVRNGGATFDVIITYGTRVETYRSIQLTGTKGQLPDAMINGISELVTVAPAAAGYGTTITAQQFSLAYDFPSNMSSGFSAADFTEGDESGIAVFEANSSLDNVEIFNLLLVPGVTDFSVLSAALAFAERKRAFMIADAPEQAPAFGSSTATPQPVQYWMEGLNSVNGPSLPKAQNGALYFPYLVSNDPVTGDNIAMAPSGFVAGIYAQTDASRGVWKAPAGLATVVLNTNGPVLSGIMNDPQQGVLNLDSINCLRNFSGVGTVVWGSRTLVAQNEAYQQWMYVPVRRMTLFIEQTLLANLRWVVFEPNDEPLWIAIVRSISAFMLSLFRQGALQGDQPSDAFQVKCDSTTTTPDDQAAGIVNIVVAFAPLKPAEFVVIKIAQLAGQTTGS
ncbi:MAG TPA: IPT/TIG domain-containing protein [Stellaceae bacterium]|nr:IPT/TIG domain-containing protein [Stellaceae bacterium]